MVTSMGLGRVDPIRVVGVKERRGLRLDLYEVIMSSSSVSSDGEMGSVVVSSLLVSSVSSLSSAESDRREYLPL